MKQHRNKFFVVFAILMVIVFTAWIWPTEQGAVDAGNTGTNALAVP
jgi:hypothetical protein